MLAGFGLDSRSTVVDLGAGTGTFSIAAAQQCARVVAVDVSPAMLALLEEKALALRVENVERVRGGFLTYTHAGPPAEFVYSRNALHHLPDFWKAIALDRVRTMLRPGGYLRLRDLVFAFAPQDAPARVAEWVAAPAVGGPEQPDRAAHVRGEHSTFAWLLEPMLERVGFQLVDVLYSADGVYGAYVCRRRF